MTEKRTYTILFGATILSARKLLEMCPTSETRFFVGYAIDDAAFILERIESEVACKSGFTFSMRNRIGVSGVVSDPPMALDIRPATVSATVGFSHLTAILPQMLWIEW